MFNSDTETDKREINFNFPRFTLILRLNGFWPFGVGKDISQTNQLLRLLHQLWAWCTWVALAFTVCGEICFFFSAFTNVAESTENLCTTMMGLISCLRLLHARFFQREIKLLLQEFAKHIRLDKTRHPEIAHHWERKLRVYPLLIVLTFSVLIMYYIFPIAYMYNNDMTLASPDKPFPYKMCFPYDAQRGWRYVGTYLLAMYAGVVAVTQFVGQDTLLALFINSTCGQFQVLHQQIAELVPYCHARGQRDVQGSDDEGNACLQRRYVQRLHELAARHSALIEFCSLLEKFNTFPLLVNMLVSMYLICMLAFQMATAEGAFIGDYVKFAIYFVAMTTQLYTVCQSGQALIDHSTITASYLYACNWEGGPMYRSPASYIQPNNAYPWTHNQCTEYIPPSVEFRRKLLFMLMRSQRPIKLTAMGFSVLSSQSFNTILSSSVSYFMLLRTLLGK